jgi:hypothetical protein
MGRVTETDQHSGLTVAGLAASAGALFRAVHLPQPDALIASVEIREPHREGGIAAGSLVLAVGVIATGGAGRAVLDLAERSGAAGVVFAGDDAGALDPSDLDGELAVFVLAPEAEWGHVYTVARTLAVSDSAGDLATPYQDLFAAANAIAAAVGGPVTIEDTTGRVLAFSSPQENVDARRLATILGRATSEEHRREMSVAGTYARIAASEDAVLLPADRDRDLHARLVLALKAGDAALGFIWVIESGGPFAADAAEQLKRFGPVISLHLLQVISVGKADRTRRRNLISSALEGAWSIEHSREFRLRAGERLVVACIEPRVGSNDIDAGYLSERACQLAEFHISAYRTRALITRRERALFCVYPASEERSPNDDSALVAQLVTSLETSLKVPFEAGVSRPVSPHHLPRARAEAELAVRASQLLSMPPGPVHIDQLGDLGMLVAIHESITLREVAEGGTLARVEAHDISHGTDYARTLRAYLRENGNVPATALALRLHANTLRYRLQRLTTLFSVDLDDPRVRLALAVQLWLTPDRPEE